MTSHESADVKTNAGKVSVMPKSSESSDELTPLRPVNYEDEGVLTNRVRSWQANGTPSMGGSK